MEGEAGAVEDSRLVKKVYTEEFAGEKAERKTEKEMDRQFLARDSNYILCRIYTGAR